MKPSAFGIAPFSAKIGLWLECEAGCVPLAQAGAEFVIASGSWALPADTRASIVVSVDGQEHRHPVRLIHGLSASNPRGKTVACDGDGLPF